jgi:hypothetical protein
MTIIELFLIAVALAMDAFTVSICKGLSIKGNKVPASLICGLWFGGFQFLMPVLGEDVYEPGEPRGPVGPDLIRKALRLEKTVFLSTACTTGREETAAAFRERGNVCAAPSGYPEGSAALMFAVRFLYEILAKGADPRRAVKVAASADGETAMFADGEAPV